MDKDFHVDSDEIEKKKKTYQISMTSMPTRVSMDLSRGSSDLKHSTQKKLNHPVKHKEGRRIDKKFKSQDTQKRTERESLQDTSLDEFLQGKVQDSDPHRNITTDQSQYFQPHQSNIYGQPPYYSLGAPLQAPPLQPTPKFEYPQSPQYEMQSHYQPYPQNYMMDYSMMQYPMMQQPMIQNQYPIVQNQMMGYNQSQVKYNQSQIISTQLGGSIVRDSRVQPRSTIFEQKLYVSGNVIYKMPSFTRIY